MRFIQTKPLLLLLCLAVIFQLSSCTTVQKITPPNLEYFQTENASFPAYLETNLPQVAKIQKDDILAVIVSSLNKESNEILNFTNINTLPVSVFSGNVGGGSQPLGYPVDSSGAVVIPLIGKIMLGGLTLQKAEDKIRQELEKSIKDPVVNVRFMNHKFSILGEVGAVGTYNLLDERTTILEAIALAGDLTIYGKRDSVTVIRYVNGKREIGKVNLRNRTVFTSPYFYVQNGDLIYVEPTKDKFLPLPPQPQAPPPSVFLQRAPIYLSLVSTVVILFSLFSR